MSEKSFELKQQEHNSPDIAQRIAQAEVIDGLPFESMEHVLYYKKRMGRAKDLTDIKLIEEWKNKV